MSPASRFPRPTTSDITKTGVELPPEASESLDKELEFERVESREGRTRRCGGRCRDHHRIPELGGRRP